MLSSFFIALAKISRLSATSSNLKATSSASPSFLGRTTGAFSLIEYGEVNFPIIPLTIGSEETASSFC
ncbi:MAG: hypothetical protein IJ748_07470 [Bacteroidales bacterium]|nr:hypothetical protein [Bacteroidales bacterium]